MLLLGYCDEALIHVSCQYSFIVLLIVTSCWLNLWLCEFVILVALIYYGKVKSPTTS